MNKRAITASFKKWIKDQGLKEKDLSLSSLPDLFLSYFQHIQFETVGEENDGDMLLYEYGTYDWGQGEQFQIGLTRQLIEAHDEEVEQEDFMYQLQVTFFYPASGFESVSSFNQWSSDSLSLTDFQRMIVNSVGYQTALPKTPLRLEITTGKV
jgi:hypothetical protein